MTLAIALGVGIFLAFANGSNDNFKGVATLYGSGATSFRSALFWGTVMTFLGSIAALVLASGLIASFSGKGLVADSTLANPAFLLSVGIAAAFTVQLATKFGFPISTTHALTGALVGAGLLASTSGVNLAKLGSTFVLPLLVSPLIAIIAASVLYPVFHFIRSRLGVTRESCVCIDVPVTASAAALSAAPVGRMLMGASQASPITFGNQISCAPVIETGAIALNPLKGIDGLHFLSAGIVSFARGLNDTPKLAAILLVANSIAPNYSLVLVASAMAAGGLLNSRKVAETMSHGVTKMTPDQGFTGNLVAGLIVVFASKFGLPVSTTHVSCGALFGIGTVTGQAKWKTIASILTAWVTTLPVAAAFGAVSFSVLTFVVGV